MPAPHKLHHPSDPKDDWSVPTTSVPRPLLTWVHESGLLRSCPSLLKAHPSYKDNLSCSFKSTSQCSHCDIIFPHSGYLYFPHLWFTTSSLNYGYLQICFVMAIRCFTLLRSKSVFITVSFLTEPCTSYIVNKYWVNKRMWRLLTVKNHILLDFKHQVLHVTDA